MSSFDGGFHARDDMTVSSTRDEQNHQWLDAPRVAHFIHLGDKKQGSLLTLFLSTEAVELLHAELSSILMDEHARENPQEVTGEAV